MKTISIYMMILVLTVTMLAGCRRRTDNETTTPTGATDPTSATSATNPTQGTTATNPTQGTTATRPTDGMMDDMMTDASEFIDDMLPDGTDVSDATGNGNDARRRMPGGPQR